jgi:anaerobic magnesium-protoporphyrin IX monomethyl ester cyclase
VAKKVADILRGLKEQGPQCDVVLVHADSFYVLARCNPGILSLATFLREQGFSVRVLTPLDLYCLSLRELEDFFRSTGAAIIGFYSNSDNIYTVRELSRKIALWNLAPRPVIIAGGPLATAQGEELMAWPYFDGIIYGEAEHSLAAYARALIRKEGSLPDVPSLIFRVGDSIRRNPPEPLIEDLDMLPPIDQSFAGSSPQVLSVTSGRGCPFGCAFCFQAVHGRRYRYRSPEKVVHEIISNLERYNLRAFSLTDDTFVAIPARVREICELLIDYREKSGRKFIFYCEGRVDILTRHPDLLEWLKKAGLVRLQIGIESGAQSVIDAYQKGIKIEEVERLVDMVKEVGGISLIGHFIIGGAFETEETFERSLAFAKNLIERAPGVFETGAGFLCLYPGTAMARDPARYSIKPQEPYFRDSISTLDATCATESLPIERLRLLKQRFHREIDILMERLVNRIPFETLRAHMQWASTYGLTSFWHPYLARREALSKYFFFLESPRFFRLSQRSGNYADMVPMRTLGILVYGSDGLSLRLQGGLSSMTLRDELKRFIYRRSCGKQTAGQIAREVRELFSPHMSVDHILQRVMLPFYRQLEKKYHMAFYE